MNATRAYALIAVPPSSFILHPWMCTAAHGADDEG